jgi:hypothetical protein
MSVPGIRVKLVYTNYGDKSNGADEKEYVAGAQSTLH